MTPKRREPRVPAFALYGDPRSRPPELLHIESIQTRSRLYQGSIGIHTHHGLNQILWVESGPVDVVLDETHEAGRGPLAVVIPPGTVHAFRFSRDSDGYILTFNPRAVIEGDLPSTGEAFRCLFAVPGILSFEAGAWATTRIVSLIRDLAEEFVAPDAVGSPVALWLARGLVWRLAQHVPRPGSLSNPGQRSLFTRFVVLVEARHREHWPVSRYALKLGTTPASLHRLTRAEAGCGALEFIHARLAREARRRLAYVALPIAALAMELGFADPAYFCRFFKRCCGMSPREFRRSRVNP